jgi:hypothetical protein
MFKPLLRGVATYLPFVKRFTNRGSGGTDSPRYCYSVWLRHLVWLDHLGLASNLRVVAELGPGDSLGTGIAAIFSGVDKYYALDVKPYFDNQTNLEMFDHLLALFRAREPIPHESEFPEVFPRLQDYAFPHHIICRDRMDAALAEDRIAAVRRELANLANQRQGEHFGYFAPWDSSAILQPETVDLAFSQAVMEHVVDVRGTYSALAKWLKRGGCMSHTIDFRSHHTAQEWNGHWSYSDFTWKLIVGTRAFLINRQPHSSHIDAIKQNGFDILVDQKVHDSDGLQRDQLAKRFRHLADDDLSTSVAFLVARKGDQATCNGNGH